MGTLDNKSSAVDEQTIEDQPDDFKSQALLLHDLLPGVE